VAKIEPSGRIYFLAENQPPRNVFAALPVAGTGEQHHSQGYLGPYFFRIRAYDLIPTVA
jgi:hypothetical protein